MGWANVKKNWGRIKREMFYERKNIKLVGAVGDGLTGNENKNNWGSQVHQTTGKPLSIIEGYNEKTARCGRSKRQRKGSVISMGDQNIKRRKKCLSAGKAHTFQA